MGNIFNNGPTYLKLIVRVRIYHILIIYRPRIKDILCPKHRPTLTPIPSTGIMKIITALMPRLNIFVKCLTLNPELNFQLEQTSYIEII